MYLIRIVLLSFFHLKLYSNSVNLYNHSRITRNMDSSEEDIEERTRIGYENTDLKKDYKNIALLLFLYLLQGLPLGLNSSMTYILSSRNVFYDLTYEKFLNYLFNLIN